MKLIYPFLLCAFCCAAYAQPLSERSTPLTQAQLASALSVFQEDGSLSVDLDYHTTIESAASRPSEYVGDRDHCEITDEATVRRIVAMISDLSVAEGDDGVNEFNVEVAVWRSGRRIFEGAFPAISPEGIERSGRVNGIVNGQPVELYARPVSELALFARHDIGLETGRISKLCVRGRKN